MKLELANCIIADEYGRILLLHRSTADLSQWELPGMVADDEELPETAAVRGVAQDLAVGVELTKNHGSAELETDEGEYIVHWFQARVVAGEPRLIGSFDFDDMDYFELEDMLSLSLSHDMQALLSKLASGDVALEASYDV